MNIADFLSLVMGVLINELKINFCKRFVLAEHPIESQIFNLSLY